MKRLILALVGASLLVSILVVLLASAVFYVIYPDGWSDLWGSASGGNVTPRHKGGIDLATGLYTRENDDLVVQGTPVLLLRRTYLSRYRVSRHFGIGTTHNGEQYLIGDGDRFQWAAVILADGGRLHFKRTSPGAAVHDAVFVHNATPTDWQGAELRWRGSGWEIRKSDGSRGLYRPCGPGNGGTCSILEWTDAAGRTIHYRRNTNGTLARMDDGGERWIAFEYDDKERVIRAYDSSVREARYTYDAAGRLIEVRYDDGLVRRYSYTDLDELATIEEPGTSIENEYRDGRCVRQINRYSDRDPYIFEFTYGVENGRVTRTTDKRSDGSWIELTWAEGRYSTSETWGADGFEPATFTYERDPESNVLVGLTLTCPDRRGQMLRHTSVVKPGQEERIKRGLVETHCHWDRP